MNLASVINPATHEFFMLDIETKGLSVFNNPI